MAKKYHINHQGKAAPCIANKRPCMYGAGDHFSSLEDANRELEKRFEKKYERQQVSLSKGLVNKDNPHLSAQANLSNMPIEHDGIRPDGKKDKKDNRPETKDYDTLQKEIDDLRAAKVGASPEEVKRINGQIRGKSIHLAKKKKEAEEKEKAQKNVADDDDLRFGEPIGITTKQIFQGTQAGPYATLPTKDVPVLRNSQRFCQHCQKEMTFDQNKATFVHSDTGSWVCADGTLTGKVNDVCPYCGTGDPRHIRFMQQAYSDSTYCSRCGGITSFAIGD